MKPVWSVVSSVVFHGEVSLLFCLIVLLQAFARIVSSCIFNFTVLGIFLVLLLYVFKLFMCQSSLRATRTQ